MNLNIVPTDDVKVVGLLHRHHVVEIDGDEFTRGDTWYVNDRRGIPYPVEFVYYNDANGFLAVWLKRMIRGRPSFPAGFNTLIPDLMPSGLDFHGGEKQARVMALVADLREVGFSELAEVLDMDPAGANIQRAEEALDRADAEALAARRSAFASITTPEN